MMRKTLLLGSATLVVVALAVFSLTLPSETQTLMTTSPDVLTTPESGGGVVLGRGEATSYKKDCPVYETIYETVRDPVTGEEKKIEYQRMIRIDFGRTGFLCPGGDSFCTPIDPCA